MTAGQMDLMIPDVLLETCATRQALERLASKWRVLVIYALLAGPQRHAQLRRRLPGISQKVLTETLRGMEADGLVERHVLKTPCLSMSSTRSRSSAKPSRSRWPQSAPGRPRTRPADQRLSTSVNSTPPMFSPL
jgi:DNA-binding HxlR family transcriptional regulator